MREHMGLFRGKRKDNGEWVEGYLLRSKIKERIRYEIYISFTEEEEKENEGHFLSAIGGIWREVDPATIGECTGLKDKNGKLIWEGDILEYNDGYDYFKGEVIFENGAFGMGSFEIIGLSSGCRDNFANLWQLFWDQEVTDEPELYYCSIIGNIHDNPELKGGEG